MLKSFYPKDYENSPISLKTKMEDVYDSNEQTLDIIFNNIETKIDNICSANISYNEEAETLNIIDPNYEQKPIDKFNLYRTTNNEFNFSEYIEVPKVDSSIRLDRSTGIYTYTTKGENCLNISERGPEYIGNNHDGITTSFYFVNRSGNLTIYENYSATDSSASTVKLYESSIENTENKTLISTYNGDSSLLNIYYDGIIVLFEYDSNIVTSKVSSITEENKDLYIPRLRYGTFGDVSKINYNNTLYAIKDEEVRGDIGNISERMDSVETELENTYSKDEVDTAIGEAGIPMIDYSKETETLKISNKPNDEEVVLDNFKMYYSFDSENYDFSNFFIIKATPNCIQKNSSGRYTYITYGVGSASLGGLDSRLGKTYFYYLNKNGDLTIFENYKDTYRYYSWAKVHTAPISNPNSKTLIESLDYVGTFSSVYYDGVILVPYQGSIYVTDTNKNIYTPTAGTGSFGDVSTLKFNTLNYNFKDNEVRKSVLTLQTDVTSVQTSITDIDNNLTFIQTTLSGLAGVYKAMGSVNTYDELPIENVKTGYVYDVIDTGMNYVAIVDEESGIINWDSLGSVFDTSNYYNKEEIDSKIGEGSIPLISYDRNNEYLIINNKPDEELYLDSFKLYYTSGERSLFNFSNYCVINAYRDSIYFDTDNSKYKPVSDAISTNVSDVWKIGDTGTIYFYFINKSGDLTIIYNYNNPESSTYTCKYYTAPINDPTNLTEIFTSSSAYKLIYEFYYDGKLLIPKFKNDPSMISDTLAEGTFVPTIGEGTFGDISVFKFNNVPYDFKDNEARKSITSIYELITSMQEEINSLKASVAEFNKLGFYIDEDGDICQGDTPENTISERLQEMNKIIDDIINEDV